MLKENIAKFILECLEKSHPGIPSDFSVKLEYARDEKFGDYACLIAMDKSWRDFFASKDPQYANPRKFADYIVETLKNHPESDRYFKKIEIAGPGFINLTITEKFLFEIITPALHEVNKGLSQINEQKYPNQFGKSVRTNPENIIFEFVSANPTGPLNIVSARAAALGDSVCNLLEASGHKVHREYYVNDFGNQVRLLGFSCLYRYMESAGIPLRFSVKNEKGEVSYPEGTGIPFPSEGYHGEYLRDVTAEVIKENPAIKPESALVEIVKIATTKSSGNKTNGNSKLSDSELISYLETELAGAAEKIGIAATSWFLETQKKDLERFRVKFHNFYSERSLHQSGDVLKAASALKKYIFEEDKKTIFRSTYFGDDKDRVVIRDDGRPTYLLADIAYHKTKIDRGYSKIINIWGPDHHGYIKRLEGAVIAMGFPTENFKVLLAQQVNLLDAGTPIVMSKRTGKFITMDTLIEEIPVDVTRYFFVMRSFEAHLDFDMTEARDTSEKNPYYYVAYAHARIKSIFVKAAEKNLFPIHSDLDSIKQIWEQIPETFDFTAERRRLLWLAARFPEEIKDAADALEPHRVITYLYNLASALSRFYAPKENRIIDQDPATAAVLLSILAAVAVCLKTGLGLLGMEAPERMIRAEESVSESN